jgi:hypothetical protein
VELTALAAGIDPGGQVGEQRGVEAAAGKGRAEHAWVNAGEMRAQAGGEHLAGKFRSGDSQARAPDGEDGFEARACEFGDAVGADVLKEEVAEGDAVQPLRGGAGADSGHARVVVGVRAGKGKIDLPERQANGVGLPVEQLFAEAVDGDAAELFVDGSEQGDDFEFGLLAEQVERPGTVLAAAPAQQDGLRGGVRLGGCGFRLDGTLPPVYTQIG